MDAKAIVFERPNQVGLGEFAMREPLAGELLVKTEYSCVSPGTELRCLRGEEAAAGSFPLIPGYATVGRVVEAGAGVEIAPGTAVYCLGTSYAGPFGSFSAGHLSCGIVAAAAAVPLPAGLALRDAVPAVLGAIALHGRTLLPEVKGKRVLVVGLGVIGQFSARLFQLAGAEVTACDRSPQRVRLAAAAGLHALCPAGDQPVVEGGAQIVVDATGSPTALDWAVGQACIPAWNPAGGYAEPVWLVVQGSYPATVEVDYQAAFRRELRLLFPRSVTYADIAETMQLVRDGRLRCADLLSFESRPEDAPAAYARLAAGDGDCLTAVFNWAGT